MRARLSYQEWEDLCRRVYERDLYQAYLHSDMVVSVARWLVTGTACVATFLDPESGPCKGDIEFDHVPDETTMGSKAEDDEQHLQSVCGWHHGTRRTGGGWATSHAARERSRAYLRSIYGGPPAAAAPSEAVRDALGAGDPDEARAGATHDDPG